MHGAAWAIVFALCSAFCMALGAGIRQRATTSPATDHTRPVFADFAWWVGVAVGVGGFGFQAVALSAGPLLLVQPLLVTSLLFMLPLGWWLNAVRPEGSQWLWSGLLAAAVALLLVLGNPVPGHGHVSSGTWLIVLGGGAAVGAGALVIARRYPGNVRAMIIAGVSGSLFGTAALLMKVATVHVHHGGFGRLLVTWQAPTLLVVAGLAVWLQQHSYQAGDLHSSFPAALVTEQVAAAVLGIMVLGEQIADGGFTRLVLGVLAVIVCYSAVRLGTTQTTTPAARAPVTQ